MCYGVLRDVSIDYPPHTGTLLTRYSPFRRSPACIATPAAPRLACVKPAASVHPEPGSNSSLYNFYKSSLSLALFLLRNWRSFKVKSVTISRYLLVLSFQSFQWTFWSPAFRFWAFKNPLVSERDCKGTLYFWTGKLFSDFFKKFFNLFFHRRDNVLIDST